MSPVNKLKVTNNSSRQFPSYPAPNTQPPNEYKHEPSDYMDDDNLRAWYQAGADFREPKQRSGCFYWGIFLALVIVGILLTTF